MFGNTARSLKKGASESSFEFVALGTTWPIERLTEELAQFRPWFLECLESSATGEVFRIDLLGDF